MNSEPEQIIPAEENAEAKTPDGGGMLNGLLEYIETFILVLGCAFLLLTFVVRICVVNGSSMEHTLSNGQKLLCSDLFYEPERGDIVVFHQTGGRLNEPLIKRVIAVPGDVIEVNYTSQIVTINGTRLNEGYAWYDPTYPFIHPVNDRLVVPEGYVYVMGDNRNNSNDSRGNDVGLVDQRRILGKVFVRIAPFSLYQ